MGSILLELRVWPGRPIYSTEKYFKKLIDLTIWKAKPAHGRITQTKLKAKLETIFTAFMAGKTPITTWTKLLQTSHQNMNISTEKWTKGIIIHKIINTERPVLQFLMASWAWTVSCVSVWPILKWKRTLNSCGRVRGTLRGLHSRAEGVYCFLTQD